MHAFANNLPHSNQVMMEGRSRNNEVIDVIEHDAIMQSP